MIESSKTFDLLTPITDGDRQVIEITLHEPTFVQIEKLTKDTQSLGSLGALRLLFMAQTGLSKPAIDQLRARDMRAMQEFITGFFGDSPTEPGSTS